MTKKKILPEGLIQKTNIQQHNFMIDAINDIEERQVNVEDINAATNADVATLKNDVVILNNVKYDKDDANALEQEFAAFPAEVQSMIIDSFDTHLKNVLVDDDMLRFSADQKAIFLQKNRRDGVTIDEQIPLSTRQNVGLATPEDLLAIDGLSSRVTTLENSGITGELFYLDHDFSGITDAVRTVHFNADIGKPPVVGDSVIDSQQRSWRYVITGPTTFGWVEVPHLSIGGDLKAVKSSNDDGKIYVENDNTCSVVGWNGIKNDVSGNTNAITGHVDNNSNPHGVTKAQVGLGAYPASPADIGISTATQTALGMKADKSEVALKADKSELEGILDLIAPPVDCAALPKMYLNDISVRVAPVINVEGCTSLKEMFSGCTSLKVANVVNTSSVTTMQSMFYNCSSLTSVPEMDTSKVTDMSYLFFGCSSLTNVPEMDTSSVKNMENMFNNCSSLTSVPPLDTSSVMNMKDMFFRCSSLTSVPPLDTSSVTTMRGMFNSCSLLTSVPPLDTSNVSSMESMFKSCSSLTSVTFTGDVVPPYGVEMFGYTPIASGDGTIYVPDNMVSSYKAASGWSAHASIIKGISEKP